MPITMCLFLGVQFSYVDQVFPFWFVLYIYCYLMSATTFALATKNQYNTPLTRAIFNGNVDIVKLLLMHDALEDHPASSGQTPLLTACVHGRGKMAEILIQSAPRILDHEPNRICTHMAIAAICCSRPVRWRARKDSLSLICFLFLMLLLPCSFLIWAEPGTCQNFIRFGNCLCKDTVTEPYYSDLVVSDLRRAHEEVRKKPNGGGGVCMAAMPSMYGEQLKKVSVYCSPGDRCNGHKNDCRRCCGTDDGFCGEYTNIKPNEWINLRQEAKQSDFFRLDSSNFPP